MFFGNAKRSFYRAANAVLGKTLGIVPENVNLHLLQVNPLRDMGRICPILEKSLRLINTGKNDMRGTFCFWADVDAM